MPPTLRGRGDCTRELVELVVRGDEGRREIDHAPNWADPDALCREPLTQVAGVDRSLEFHDPIAPPTRTSVTPPTSRHGASPPRRAASMRATSARQTPVSKTSSSQKAHERL